MRNIKFTPINNTVYGIPRFTFLGFDLISFEEKKIAEIYPMVTELLPLAHAKGRLIGANVWRGDKNKARLVIEAPSGLEGWIYTHEQHHRCPGDALLWGMGLDASLGWRKDSLEMLTEFASSTYTTPLDVVEKARKMAGEYVAGRSKQSAYLIELAGAIVAARILRSKDAASKA